MKGERNEPIDLLPVEKPRVIESEDRRGCETNNFSSESNKSVYFNVFICHFISCSVFGIIIRAISTFIWRIFFKFISSKILVF